MNFASDNTAGVAPAILDAIARANEGYALGYGEAEITARVEGRLADVFEHELAVFLLPTGTAANALALAQLTRPWSAVLCHAESHIVVDECGATEFYGGGLRVRVGDPPGRARTRPLGRSAPRHAGGAVALAGDRSWHQLPRLGNPAAGGDRPRA